jgi:transposase
MDSATRFAGIDWAMAGHAICVIDGSGVRIDDFKIEHTAADLRTLVRRLRQHAVAGVAIERGDGPVVDALLAANLTVVVIASRTVKGLRTRYGLAGNKDDRSDAYLLADVLRTDGQRLRPLVPNTPATVTLRATVRARKDLISARLRLTQQLGAHLDRVFPGAVGLFSEPDSPITLHFLARFPSAARAAWLTPRRLTTWLKSVGYSGHTPAELLIARLERAPAGVTGEEAGPLASVTLAFVGAIGAVCGQIERLEAHIAEQLAAHADAAIFTSLPRSGSVRAAALLAEMGDCRARFPSPESLAGLGGAAPSTRQSGKHRVVTFRYACDKKLRNALLDFADGSRFANAWAAEIYRLAIARKKTHQHAVRILAHAWVPVIWRCWQDGVPYDPAKHGALQRVLRAQAACAASQPTPVEAV